jgi:hypothetical protein
MINQLLVGVHIAVAAEGIALAARVGVNLPAPVRDNFGRRRDFGDVHNASTTHVRE